LPFGKGTFSASIVIIWASVTYLAQIPFLHKGLIVSKELYHFP